MRRASAQMQHDAYATMATPVGRCDLQMTDDLADEVHTESQINRALQIDGGPDDHDRAHHVQFNGAAMSDRSSRVSRSEMGRSLARIYEPTLQERAQHFLEGRSGLYLELVNLACSVLIFGLYIVELYDHDLDGVTLKRATELTLTSFFIFDLGLHIFVTLHPLQYLLSVYGLIDLVTIIPSFLMYFATKTKSQTFFILRVLRIFRALRVLRLKRFIRFKQHGFNYELSVFILSSVAIILCAAGMYHAVEEAYYLDHEEPFYFHQALYFILVTMSTVGYGDISPQTTLGEVFVMIMIIAVFTIVPQKVAKLNDLAKQNHPYDKDYTRRSKKRSGHVIVSGYDLTTDSILDFLDEFYHPSRGNINLDVVFMSEAIPTPAVLRLLSTERFVQRTKYLRGNLANSHDQKRARLAESTAVFFLANKLVRRESAQQDARTVLHTLAVRNYADSSGIHLDIYTQLRSREQELEMTAQLLGSNTTNTSELQTMILSRSAACSGATTLILNLLHSVSKTEYASSHKDTKHWIDEYVDGMCFQIFPIIFTKRFQFEKYQDVVRNIYEQYRALLIMVRPRRRRRPSNAIDPDFRISPFHTCIREGDIGILIAKSAAAVLHIANTYGFWRDNEGNENRQAHRRARPVRVSSDSLMKRPSLKQRLQHGKSALSLLEQSRSLRSAAAESGTPNSESSLCNSVPPSVCVKKSSFSSVSGLEKSNETLPPVLPTDVVTEMDIVTAARSGKTGLVQSILEIDHFYQDARHFEDHFVVTGGRLRDALSIVAYVKEFYIRECDTNLGGISQFGTVLRFTNRPKFILLVEQYPPARDMSKVLMIKEEYGEDVSTLLRDVGFICGSSSRVGDLRNAAIDKARRVIILPVPNCSSKFKLKPSSPRKASSSSDAQTLSHENLTDFGVLNSLLVSEVAREEVAIVGSGRLHVRRRQSSRQPSAALVPDVGESSLTYFRREMEQGIPLESIKIRMLERYPDLQPSMFNQLPEAIESALVSYDSDSSLIDTSSQDVGVTDGYFNSDDINIIALLYHASSAKFCRPRDPAVNHDVFPCLAPSFASGDVFLSSVLDRIMCQAFFNPYITDVVRILACGDSVPASAARTRSSSPNVASANQTRRLFQMTIDESYAGTSFETVFNDFLELDMLVIAILRAENAALENLRPFVYTCPNPDTTMHSRDRLFILG